MATTELLQARVEGLPSIYAYELPEVPSHRGLLKVGYTVRTAEERVAEQCRTAHLKYKIVLVRSAMKADGTSFDDHAVHRVLRGAGFSNPEGGVVPLHREGCGTCHQGCEGWKRDDAGAHGNVCYAP